MKLIELFNICPQAILFVVKRDADFKVNPRILYLGENENANRVVTRIVPTSYPMYKHVMEVEIE